MRRHPLLWKLALLQISFCLLLTWFIWIWGLSAERSTYLLSAQERDYLRDYAQQAQDIWREQGTDGLERFSCPTDFGRRYANRLRIAPDIQVPDRSPGSHSDA